MAVYFVSDFHLGEGDASADATKAGLFRRFLDIRGDDMQRLIILGDLFDFWFEYRHLIPKHNLRMLYWLGDLVTAGVEVSYVAGNHDHWMGDFLPRELGIRLLREKVEIETPKGKILAMHGDGVVKSDHGYRLLRRILRNRFNVALYRLLPPTLAFSLAKGAARMSRSRSGSRPPESFMDGYLDFAKGKFQDGYFAFVCGHTHHPELRRMGDHFYVNSGDWIKHFSFVRYAGEEFSLEYASDLV